jgi:hypothetical protein
MKRRPNASALNAAIGSLLLAQQSAAQPTRTPVDITPCVAIESAVARLDCYDELVKNAPRDRGEPAAQARTPVTGETLAPRSATDEPPAVEIVSEIVGLRETVPGRLEITLANGQVWRQTSSDRYHLQVGHSVRVYRARLSSLYFRLTAPVLRGFVQVERVR